MRYAFGIILLLGWGTALFGSIGSASAGVAEYVVDTPAITDCESYGFFAINNRNQIIGACGNGGVFNYVVFNGKTHVNIMNRNLGQISGINNDGAVVGFRNANQSNFVWRNGVFTNLPKPPCSRSYNCSASGTAMGINVAGHIIVSGSEILWTISSQGITTNYYYRTFYVYRAGNWNLIKRIYQGHSDSDLTSYYEPLSINDKGEIVGSYWYKTNSNGWGFDRKAFYVSQSRAISFLPDSFCQTPFSTLISINNNGRILCSDYLNNNYLYLNGEVSTVANNISNLSRWASINDNDVIVGVREYGNGILAVPDKKNLGDCGCVGEGNPINASNGNKFQIETDFVSAAHIMLPLRRYYNSRDHESVGLGIGWRSDYHRSVVGNPGLGYASVVRGDGRTLIFQKNASGKWLSAPDVTERLSTVPDSGAPTGWQLTTADDDVESYDISGKLTSVRTRAGLIETLSYDDQGRLANVQGPFGHRLTFAYDAANRISQASTPDGRVYKYYYDTRNNLASVVYPDGARRAYLYENSRHPHALTGIVDEKNIRYATFGYDDYYIGWANSSEHAGGVDRVDVVRVDGGDTTAVARAGGGENHTYFFERKFNGMRPLSVTGAPIQSSGGKAFAYDANGFISSRIDWRGNVTTYTHDSRGSETSRTEASGTPLARKIATTWHAAFHLPTKIVEPGRTTTFSYDDRGNLLTKAITAGALTRSFSYTYNSFGQVLTAIDPLGHVTTYAYDAKGNLVSVKNALGHVTSFTNYDGAGRLLRAVDPNGLVTTLTYDVRGRITSRKEGGLTTSSAYDAVGNLTRITLPDASYLALTYDGAHRLKEVADAFGNRRVFTLDNRGNVTKEEVFDTANVLKRTRSYIYDSVNRLIESISARNQFTHYGYDDQGNLTSTVDPDGHRTAFAYDGLNRLTQTVDPNGGVAARTYDPLDHLTSITDPRGLKTGYAWNGLDNQPLMGSPDTGATAKTFDAAGNVLSSTDGRGKKTTFAYDALNRLTTTVFADGTSVTREYDHGVNGRGRLTRITDPIGSTSYAYDLNGRVTQKTQTVGAVTLTTGYAYYAGGRLARITYPSGKAAVYYYDVAGRVNRVTAGVQTMASGVAYQPFGAVTGWTFGNGAVYGRTFDSDGRVTGLSLPANDNLALQYDWAGRIERIADSAVSTKAFSYDKLDRLTNYVGGALAQAYGYDASGNRTSALLTSASATTSLAYAISPTSNRLASISGGRNETFTYDAAGNLLVHRPDNYLFSHGAHGRMAQSRLGALTTNYGINGLGQRVVKADPANANSKTHFVYDEAGHLIGEYGPTGALVQETVWLGDLPIATLRPSGTFYVAPDHLGSPHQITNAAKQVVWLWDHDPFGNGAPTSVGGFTYNLRFPGQYYDAETGLHYNYFRDYDPKLGRYVQSDPIGLAGGINTYAYVGGNPVSFADPMGLACNSNGCWLTAVESSLAGAGDYRGYYATACSGGDNYACAAGQVASNQGWAANLTNWRLERSIIDNGAKESECPNKMESIRIELAKSHADALRNGSPEDPIVLSGSQISEFHNKIFMKYGAGAVFGGDIPGSNMIFRWCSLPSCRQ